MDRTAFWYVAFQQSKFVLLSLVVFYLFLLPVDFVPGRFYPPNFVLVLAIASVIRMPQLLPVWLVFVVFLLQDILLYHPLGLSSLTMILVTLYLKTMRMSTQGMNFGTEWGFVGIVLILATIFREMLLIVIFADRNPIFGTFAELAVTILYYPVAVLCISLLFKAAIVEKQKADDA